MINPDALNNIEIYMNHYKENGWVSIPNFLDVKFAEKIYETIHKEQRWEIATLRDSKPFVVSLKEFHQQTPQFKNQFMNEILLSARQNKFQYFYEFIRLVGEDSRNLVGYDDLIEFISSFHFQETLCKITALEKNSKIDAQLTKYSPGCFLKQHCDTRLEISEERHSAYIFNVSKNWSADYGGLLNIQDNEGNVIKSLVPKFNTLNLLSIPFEHFVSQVANYANVNRYSLTGWIWKNR